MKILILICPLVNNYIDEEIVADINAGINEYSDMFAEDVSQFRKAVAGELNTANAKTSSNESKSNYSAKDYAESIDGGGETNQNREFAEDNGVRFSTDKNYTYAKQVHDALENNNKLPRGFSIRVGETPQLLQKAGLDSSIILMNQSHLRDINHKKDASNPHFHGISEDIIVQLPNMLKRPVAIYDSISEENKENSICVLTDKVDGDGSPIIVSLKKSNENSKYYNASFEVIKTDKNNFATSLYGKDNMAYHINDILDNDAFIYVTKSKMQSLIKKISQSANSDVKLQLLERLDAVGYDKIIHQSRNIVNTHSMQNSEKDTQIKFSMSKPVDKIRFSVSKKSDFENDAKADEVNGKLDNYKTEEYNKNIDTHVANASATENAGLENDYTLSESGELDGYGKDDTRKELGRISNIRSDETSAGVDKVGHLQQKAPNTPHTKSVHRSGVSAEVVTSSGLTAEQAQLKAQNKIEGVDTEYFVKAKTESGSKDSPFNTENTAYYPDRAFERNGIVIKDGVASFTQKRFEDLIEEFSVPVGGQANQNYAKGYVAYISPSDFLSLTTNDENHIIKQTRTNTDIYGNGKLDVNRLASARQTPFLEIDFDDGTVYGHEGRHRMVMLRDAGIDKVAIVVKSLNPEEGKYSTQKMQNVSVTGQVLNGKKASGKVILDEIIPLSPAYRDEVAEKFVDKATDVKFSATPKKSYAEQFETQDLIRMIADDIGYHEGLIEASRKNKSEFVALAKANDSLTKRLENAKSEMKRTKTPKANDAAVLKHTKSIIDFMQSKIKAQDISDKVSGIYNQFNK